MADGADLDVDAAADAGDEVAVESESAPLISNKGGNVTVSVSLEVELHEEEDQGDGSGDGESQDDKPSPASAFSFRYWLELTGDKMTTEELGDDGAWVKAGAGALAGADDGGGGDDDDGAAGAGAAGAAESKVSDEAVDEDFKVLRWSKEYNPVTVNEALARKLNRNPYLVVAFGDGKRNFQGMFGIDLSPFLAGQKAVTKCFCRYPESTET